MAMGALSLLVSGAVVLVTQRALPGPAAVPVSVAVVGVVVALGLAFDMVGVSVAACPPEPFHARAARHHPGAVQSLRLIAHADRVANFCLDFVGDVAGTLAGALATGAAYRLSGGRPDPLWGAVAVGMVAGANVGLKAVAKTLALADAVAVVRLSGEVLFWTERLGLPPLFGGRSRRHAPGRGRDGRGNGHGRPRPR
jgi:hypothetical protein